MTLHEFSADAAPAIQAFAALLGLVSLLLLWHQIRKTNDWNRVSAALQIMELERFYQLEKQATNDCKAIGVPFPAAITKEHAQKVRNQYEAYHSVKNLVIFLDRISVAYQAGYIDKDVVTFTYGPLLAGYYSHLEAYIILTRPPRQNSCRPNRTKNPGAAMKDDGGSIRTSIQGQSGITVTAAGERGAGGGCAGSWYWSGNPGALARGCAVQARPRAGLDCGRPA